MTLRGYVRGREGCERTAFCILRETKIIIKMWQAREKILRVVTKQKGVMG
jgi:hypothetical protein